MGNMQNQSSLIFNYSGIKKRKQFLPYFYKEKLSLSIKKYFYYIYEKIYNAFYIYSHQRKIGENSLYIPIRIFISIVKFYR